MNSAKKTAKADARQRVVDEESAGQRLDNFLLAVLKGVPRSHVYRLIRSGQVRVNSGRAQPSRRLSVGDAVRIPPVAARPDVPAPERGGSLAWLAERIVHEDGRVLVLDKPAGLAVHGGSSVELGCIEALRTLRPDLKDAELAHRLDRATSGCLLIAKRRSALRTLHALFREGRVDKRYFALAHGRWPKAVTRVDAPLEIRKRHGEARVQVSRAGKESVSEFGVLQGFGARASLLEVAIGTGRTHQIRVHAAHVGHPLAGDDRYGDRERDATLAPFGLKRLFLHAHALGLTWPDTGEDLAVGIPLPAELQAVLDALSRG